MKAVFFKIGLVVVLLVTPSAAQDPCAGPHARALVLGGGGSKGAFEVGGAYHLIVHRGCDFTEFSGTSVGALNSAVLAQAARSVDPEVSLARLKGQAEALVSMWQSIRSSKDVYKGRPLAFPRLILFGTESLKNFAPLGKLIKANVDLERLEDGRKLRVATVSFHDGRYHEFVLNENGQSDPRTLGFLLASAAIPMFATMPRIEAEKGHELSQFADAGLRHKVPIRNYFVQCGSGTSLMRCRNAGNHGIPPHDVIEQLFVITTTPYDPDLEVTPVWEPSVFKLGTKQITDGRTVIARSIGVIMESAYHGDLDWALFANDLLKWHSLADTSSSDDSRLDGFPLESYNYDPKQPDTASQPYRMGVVTPAVGDAGLDDILSFSRERIAKHMYCGCLAANEMMQKQFALESMGNACRERFHPLGDGALASNCGSRVIEPVWRTAVSTGERLAGNSH